MPSFVKSVDQHTGKIVYLYSISGEDPVTIARQLIQNADAPFSYQGRIQGRTGALPIENIGAMLDQGGEVAGQAMVNSTSVIVRFLNPDEISLTPADAIKATADMLVGLPGNSFDDAEFGFGDPYGGDDFGNYNDGGFVDPRGARASDMNNVPLYNDGTGFVGGGEQPVGIGEWILTLILLAIPVVNIVMLIVWLVSKKTKKSKKNYIITQLIFTALAIIITGVLIFLFGAQIKTFVAKYNNTNANQIVQTTNSNSSYNTASNSAYSSNTTSNSNSVFDSNSTSTQNSLGSAANANMASNAGTATNANTTSNTISGGNTTNQNVANGFSDSTVESGNIQVSTTVDNLLIDEVVPGTRIAILTATMNNESDVSISPHDALKITGAQGNTLLNWVVEPSAHYETQSINTLVTPGGAGTFQAAYYVDGTNGNPVHITIQNMKTGALLADQSVPVL